MGHRRLGFLTVTSLAVAAWVSVAVERGAHATGDEWTFVKGVVARLEEVPEHKVLAADPIQKAKKAMERAESMQAAGDTAHATLALGLARTWALTAADLVRAVDLETQASEVRRQALDAGAHSERERAMLEEGIAHNGRLRAQLESIEREEKEAPPRTSRLSLSKADAGSPSAPAPARKGDRADAGAKP